MEKLKTEKEVVGFYISGHPLDQYKFEIDNFCNTDLGKFNNMDDLRGKILRIGGIVTDISHRTSRNGNPFGILTLEDYNGSYSFYLFSDDYLKYKQFFEVGWFLYIKGTVSPQKWRNDELEFKIQEMNLLSDIREKLCKGITLSVNLEDVTEAFADQLEEFIKEHPGNCVISCQVHDVEENVIAELMSRKYKIGTENEVFEQLENQLRIEYSVTTT